LRADLDVLKHCTNQLKTDCEQYIDYASDGDERELIVNAKSSLEVLLKTSSSAQIDGIGKEIVKLERLAKELSMAMNKDEMKA